MTKGRGNAGEKLLTLARDIGQHGLNPVEKVIVTEDTNRPGEYVVLEGNRRVTALKLLNNPDLAPTKEWADRFRRLRDLGGDTITTIPCLVVETAEDAYHFIALKHQGEAGGAGTVSWDPEQRSRHELRVKDATRHHKALKLIDYVKENSDDKDARAFAASEFPITTLDRLLTDAEFREFIGLCLTDDGELAFRIDPAEAIKPINKVFKDFGSGTKKVGDVINKERREEYIQEFGKHDLPDQKRVIGRPVRIDDTTEVEIVKGKTDEGWGHNFPGPKTRRKIVLPGARVAIDARRYNRARRVFEELRKLPIKNAQDKPEFPNAGILLVRLFIELSVNAFIDSNDLKHPGPDGWKNVSLTERIRAVVRHLDENDAIDGKTKKVIEKALGASNKLANPSSLNDYAHSAAQVPVSGDIMDIWDTYVGFLSAIWEALRER